MSAPPSSVRPAVSAARGPDGRIVVEHDLDEVDDDLAELLAEALTPLTDDHRDFVRAFTDVVLSSDPDPVVAWERFYRASLARLDDPRRTGYVEIHRHALELLPRSSVLELGCSFGFLALHLARLGVRVTACEPEVGTAALLTTMSTRLGMPVDVRTDVATIADRSLDAVALIHVLEHVDEHTGFELVQQAMRVARRRVVVAVPFEEAPVSLYGHVRRLDGSTLAAIGERTAWETTVHEHHGGWLVMDRPVGSPSGRTYR